MATHARAAALAVGLALGACRISTPGLRLSHSASASASAGASSSGASSPGDAPSSRTAGAPSSTATTSGTCNFNGELGVPRIRAAQLITLRGLTLDQAKHRLEKFGHCGDVRVMASGHCSEGCRDGTVCYTIPQDGMRVDDGIELCMNATFTIAPPPPP